MTTRDHSIDGIRGWAALAVVLFHFFKEALKGIFPAVEDTWIFAPLYGEFYVFIFFLLSGEALSKHFTRTNNFDTLNKLVARRYFRLTVPIALSSILIFIAIKITNSNHLTAAIALNSERWLGEFIAFEPSIPRLIKFMAIDVYTKHSRETSYNPFLWTMSIEMIGSMLVFLYLYLWNHIKSPIKIAATISAYLLFSSSLYCLFFVGIIFSALDEKFSTLREKRRMSTSIATCIAIPTCFAVLHSLRHTVIPIAIYSILSIIMVASIKANPTLYRTFSSRISVYLGNISFSLYITHFLILVTLLPFLTLRIDNPAENPQLVFAAMGLCVIASIGFAHVFTKLERKITPIFEAMATKAFKSKG